MKFLISVVYFIFGLFTFGFSQTNNNETLHLNNLPASGLLLDKGWKFHAGDDATWARPEINDQDWQSIDPSLAMPHVSQFKKTNIGWLRLKLVIDSSFMNQSFGILISQVGASEIYIDGILSLKLGTVSGEKEKEHTYYQLAKPYSIKMDGRRIHTIAVRYSFSNKGFLMEFVEFKNYCLRIILNSVGNTFAVYQNKTRNNLIYELSQASLWLILGLISSNLFMTLPVRKVYLLIGIFSFSACFAGILGGIIAPELINTGLVNYAFIFGRALAMLSQVFALIAIRQLFNQAKNWYYYTLLLGGILAVAIFFFSYDNAQNIYLVITLLFGLEYMRRSLIAIRHRFPGAAIVFYTQALFFVFVAIASVFINLNAAAIGAFFGFLAIVNIPIGWSLFVAGEYSRTGNALQSKVKEIEQLSQIAITQEQEKQQILANQNEVLENKVVERTAQLNQSLKSLQSTQAQLIQSEKMASLGELTAGIAHEIQNPLNFVNNFTEVNTELIDELEVEVNRGNLPEIKAIANDIKENEKKINHHGKRADAIVKGMLQHSRISTGLKEKSNINLLADEYLRIAYRGLYNRESSIHINIKTDFDSSIGDINIVPQDIGRLLLNLYNNAFYAIVEKSKQFYGNYEPTISLSTKKLKDSVEISVSDNGMGISQKIIDKIFQPFFTTKPTGHGTGLGLSISYDIVKVHGGEIKVNTVEGEYTNFIIQIPLV